MLCHIIASIEDQCLPGEGHIGSGSISLGAVNTKKGEWYFLSKD